MAYRERLKSCSGHQNKWPLAKRMSQNPVFGLFFTFTKKVFKVPVLTHSQVILLKLAAGTGFDGPPPSFLSTLGTIGSLQVFCV